MKNPVDKFLSLRCAGDVLEVVQRKLNRPVAEIAEAMAIIDAIKPITLREPGRWKIAEIYSGVPLVGLISAFLLPVELVTAYSYRRALEVESVNHFRAGQTNFGSDFWRRLKGDDTIVVSSHPHRNVACEIAQASYQNDFPMAMVPGPAKGLKFFGVWASMAADEGPYCAYTEMLADDAVGKAKFLGKDFPSAANVLIHRGLSCNKKSKRTTAPTKMATPQAV